MKRSLQGISDMDPRDQNSYRLFAYIAGGFVLLVLAIVFVCESFEIVKNGEYDILQRVSGGVEAHMQAGPYWQNFGNVEKWPVAETYEFEVSSGKGDPDNSISVRFNDGATCRMSGTARVDMPKTQAEAIALIKDKGFHTHTDVTEKLVKQSIKKAMSLSANLMTARESYNEKRSDFFHYVEDQLNNGPYETEEVEVSEVDPATNQMVKRTHKKIKTDKTGSPIYGENMFNGTGIKVSSVVLEFNYEQKVQDQIANQQQALMAVQTARANAQKAEQDAITIEANGKADVMKAKYEKEQEKVKAEVSAQQEQSVAVIKAQQQVDVASKTKEQALIAAGQIKEVAKIDLEAALLQKQKAIELATGESEGRKLILAADGALAQKLDTYVKVNQAWAEAFAKRQVPSVITGSAAGGKDGDASMFMEMLGAKAASDLSLNLKTQQASK